jgi:E3 ubiquitin-protein ligase DOA10
MIIDLAKVISQVGCEVCEEMHAGHRVFKNFFRVFFQQEGGLERFEGFLYCVALVISISFNSSVLGTSVSCEFIVTIADITSFTQDRSKKMLEISTKMKRQIAR